MELTLVSKQPVADGVWSYRFAPSEPLDWEAGQFVRLEVPHAAPDGKGSKRFYTVASAPFERDIEIITRLSDSSFKRALDGLEPGRTARLLDRPSGDFVWRDTPHPKLFVAQGIGITPFLAIMKHRHQAGLDLALHLVYANQPGIPPLLGHMLENWQAQHSELSVSLVDAPVTAGKLAQIAPDLSRSLIYICGPKPLIPLMGPPYDVPASQLKHDRFSGYSTVGY